MFGFGWGSKKSGTGREKSPPRSAAKTKASDLQALGIDPALFKDPVIEDDDDDAPQGDDDVGLNIEAHVKALQPGQVDHAAIDAAMKLASGLHDDGDINDVELTEDDLNDPSLLEELDSLNGDTEEAGSTSRSRATPTEDVVAALQSKLEAEKQRCLALKRAGQIPEAQQVLLVVKDLQAQIDKHLGNGTARTGSNDKRTGTHPTPTRNAAAPAPSGRKPSVESLPQKPSTRTNVIQSQPQVNTPTVSAAAPPTTDQRLVLLKARFEQYKSAYAQYKEAGDTNQAKDMLNSIRIINEMSQTLQQGKSIDIAKLPPEPVVMLVPQLDEVEQQRLANFAKLEKEFTAQIKATNEQAKKLKESPLREDKQKAVELYRRQKEMMEDLKTVIAARESGQPVPRCRYDVKQTQEELVFSHLRDYELEVGIVRCHHLPVPKEIASVESYVYVTFPYPKTDAPQNLKSTSVVKSLDPVYNWVGKLEIERKKSFLRFCERKRPITFEIYHRKLLGRDVLLGKGEVSLDGLINKCEVTEQIDIQKPSSRKSTGCKLEVCLRLRTPLQGKDVRLREEKILVLDPTAPLAPSASSLVPGTTQAAQSSPATPVSLSSSPVVAVPSAQASPLVTGAPPTVTAASPQRASAASPISSKPATQTAAAAAAASGAPTTPPAFDPSTYDPDDVDDMVSNNVLEEELRLTEIELKKSPKNEDLLDRKQQIQLKLNLLVVQIENGLLTMDAYVARLQAKINEGREIAKQLVKSGQKEAAKKVLTRVKIMEKELTEGGEDEEDA